MDHVIAAQRWIHGVLGSELSAFAASGNWRPLLAVLPLGIVFGALHALTPGHGKTVLAAYLLGSRLTLVRGLSVAGTLAVTHIATAVLIVLLAAPLVTRTLSGIGQTPALETLSRGLLAAIGVWLLVRALRRRPHAAHEGPLVGVIAGLVPCPLTLFAMIFAVANGVPEAGIAFAFAMMAGVAVTLGLVAFATITLRNWTIAALARHDARLRAVMRGLDIVTGVLLIGIGGWSLLR
jgi:nickel/cobalt transporter (NicO) family protein